MQTAMKWALGVICGSILAAPFTEPLNWWINGYLNEHPDALATLAGQVLRVIESAATYIPSGLFLGVAAGAGVILLLLRGSSARLPQAPTIAVLSAAPPPTAQAPRPTPGSPGLAEARPAHTVINQNVSSRRQSGGITAHTVNFAREPRRLSQPRSEALKQKILKELPRDKEWEVVSLLGDIEACQFAAEIRDFMKENGFKITSDVVIQAVFLEPVVGLVVEQGETRWRFVVGADVLGDDG